ncbi:transposase [Patescibacteria group bacterium]|nr:transposase [Patescibacteria group bacterium]
MKKYICPRCKITAFVIRQRKRGKSITYLCKTCCRYFSVNVHFPDDVSILVDHLSGLSYRKLAEKYRITKSTACRIVLNALGRLPNNNEFTKQYCSRFSQVLLVDGKYIHVKGYDQKIPLLWGIDYFTHDIPVFTLAPSENYQSWARFFSLYRILNYLPQLLVCDDNASLKMAARYAFPKIRIQTCWNHFKETIRKELNVRSDPTYRYVSRAVDNILLTRQPTETFNRRFGNFFTKYGSDPVAREVLTNIERNKEELLAYKWIRRAPFTNNLMECFNSHLEARLTPLKGFNSYADARLWLNGYVLKRRFTAFTSCSGKFRHLNRKRSIDITKKKGIDLPILFG